MTSGVRAAVAAAVLVTTAAAGAHAQQLLEVPYIQQSEALCGGAAVAMVMRYWGETGVYAETFAPLVDRAAGGIRGDALLGALRERGWEARSFRGDAALVQQRLAARQPVIALIEDRPGAFHYVVVVAWTADRVVLHDPARTPFRVLSQSAFESAWDKSSRWTLLALPPEGDRPLKGPVPGTAPDGARPSMGPVPVTGPPPCGVEAAVRTAGEGDLAAAMRMLEAAAAACPREP